MIVTLASGLFDALWAAKGRTVMCASKAEFFDSQVEEEWATIVYSEEKLAKVDRMLRLARVQPGMKVLEPGCGTGRLTRILADRVGSSGHVVAMDISAKMVDACSRNTRAKACVEVVCASVEGYPLSPGEFDAVICHQVFPHFDDKVRAVSLFAASLKPFGNLAIFHFINSSQINSLHRHADEAVHNDLMPPEAVMRSILQSTGFQVDLLEDDERGYLLISHVVR